MGRWFRIWIVPAAVFQSVLIGGGYGTGREIVEFISRFGPAHGLAGILLAGALWGLVLGITFEFARRFRVHDYRSFFKILIGRYWVLYEITIAVGLVLVLAVCAAAAGTILRDSLGLPYSLGIALVLVIVGVLNYFGRSWVERALTAWSLVMSTVFIGFAVLTFIKQGDRIALTFATTASQSGWLFSAFQFFLYNVGIAPLVLYAAAHQETTRQAFGAGLVAGLFAVVPGVAFHVAFMAQYPAVLEHPLPTYWMLQGLGVPWLVAIYLVVLLVTTAKTGVGMLQGLNERLDNWWKERHGRALSARAHAGVALGATCASLLLAMAGIVALVAKGYGSMAWAALAVYVVPILTIGIWKMRARHPVTAPAWERSVAIGEVAPNCSPSTPAAIGRPESK